VIPYDSMKDPTEYVAEMKKLGFTHLYINLSSLVKDQAFAKRWVASMGLQIVRIPPATSDGPPRFQVTQVAPEPLPEAEHKDILDNPVRWQDKWEVLLADAAAKKLIVPIDTIQESSHWILFKIQ